MIEQLLQSVVPTVVQVIELIGVAIISVGALVTLVQFAVATARGTKTEEAVGILRSNLGRAILVGWSFWSPPTSSTRCSWSLPSTLSPPLQGS
jgi:uncharacterized membrane protein